MRFKQIVTDHSPFIERPVPGDCLTAPVPYRAIGQRAVKKQEWRVGVQLFLGDECALHLVSLQTRDTRLISHDDSPGLVLVIFSSSSPKYVSS